MTILLSLVTAGIFGASDFFGGLAAKRATILQVVAGSHLIGLVGVAIAAPLLAEQFSLRGFALGAIGGVFGGLGVGMLYRRLAIGPMAAVAPVAAMSSAAVPAGWQALRGETLSMVTWTGVVLAIIAIGLVSTSRGGPQAAVTVRVIIESLLAGAGFGAFFIFLDATEAINAPWPVVGGRLATGSALVGFILLTRRDLLPSTRPAIWFVALAGLLDTSANITFLYATTGGSLSIVAVLSSLYPIGTVVLARIVLAERVGRIQQIGFGVALAATAMIAAG